MEKYIFVVLFYISCFIMRISELRKSYHGNTSNLNYHALITLILNMGCYVYVQHKEYRVYISVP
jgi:hypothetical protein